MGKWGYDLIYIVKRLLCVKLKKYVSGKRGIRTKVGRLVGKYWDNLGEKIMNVWISAVMARRELCE